MSDPLDHYLAWEVENETVDEVVVAARRFIDAGADVDAVDQYGWSRLYRLVFGLPSACPLVSVQALLALGSDVRAGADPLGAAVWGSDEEYQADKAAVIDLLVAAGCDVHDVDSAGVPLIEGAVGAYSHGSGYRSSDGFSCTSTLGLVARGVDPGFICSDGDTLLHRAARAGSLDAVRGLLHAGASPRVRSSDGRWPAELAEGYAEALERAEPVRLLDMGITTIEPQTATKVERQYDEYVVRRLRNAEGAAALLRAAGTMRRAPTSRPRKSRYQT